MKEKETREVDEYAVVLITVPPSNADDIARKLVECKLVACVNVVRDIKSLYWWEGKVVEDNEALLICKTRQDLLRELVDYVKKIHPYSVPEVLALSVSLGNPEYLKWVKESTREPRKWEESRG